MKNDEPPKGIKKAGQIVDDLTQLTLKIGTLIAVIKMVIDSLS